VVPAGWGRYTQSDPLDFDTPGFLGGFNYAYDNPIRWYDPEGLETRTRDDYINCFIDPFGCGSAARCAKEATKATRQRFGYDRNNTDSNAYKHCYLNCCMTKRVGRRAAERWGDGHENYPGNPKCERDMDLHNNKCWINVTRRSRS
jgi:hypothetical protein